LLPGVHIVLAYRRSAYDPFADWRPNPSAYPSFRRRPESMHFESLDSGFCRNDG
jgi:hypothetical protein